MKRSNFARALLTGAAIASGAPSASAQYAEPPPAHDAPDPLETCNSFSEKHHLLGLGLDVGSGRDSVAARYLHSHLSGGGCRGLGVVGWLGYGAELRTDARESGIGYAVARAGMAGDAGGASLELGLGGGTNFDRSTAAGIAGLFFSMYYVDFGGSYQFPIGHARPAWLGNAQFAVRVHIPLDTHDRREREYPAPR